MSQSDPRPTSPRAEVAILAVACLLPTLVTWAYFVWAAGSASGIQQGVYAVAKVVQFVLPVAWVGWICRERLRWPPFSGRGIGLGLAFGVAVALAMGLLYWTLAGGPLIDNALVPIRDKIAGLGVATPLRFAVLGVFYSVAHSLLEEYYWRWFVFGRLQRIVALAPAIAVSSIAFATHHVIVLWAYFSHSPLAVGLLAASISVGGAFWAWLYHRSNSIYASWLSHLCVDAAIFAIGFDAARPLFRS